MPHQFLGRSLVGPGSRKKGSSPVPWLIRKVLQSLRHRRPGCNAGYTLAWLPPCRHRHSDSFYTVMYEKRQVCAWSRGYGSVPSPAVHVPPCASREESDVFLYEIGEQVGTRCMHVLNGKRYAPTFGEFSCCIKKVANGHGRPPGHEDEEVAVECCGT